MTIQNSFLELEQSHTKHKDIMLKLTKNRINITLPIVT